MRRDSWLGGRFLTISLLASEGKRSEETRSPTRRKERDRGNPNMGKTILNESTFLECSTHISFAVN